MSTTLKQSTNFGVEFTIRNVPETYEEFDTAAGQDKAALSDAIKNVVYRGSLPSLRLAFFKALEKETGLARKTKSVGEGDKVKTVSDETDGEYTDRVLAQFALEDLSSYQSLADTVSESNAGVFDPKPSVRGDGLGPKLAKKWEDAGKQVVATGRVDAFVAKYGAIPDGLSDEDIVRFIGNKFKAAYEAKMKAAAADTLV